jgi:hypothetical protein
LLEAVAVAVHLQDLDMVCDAVQQCSGEALWARSCITPRQDQLLPGCGDLDLDDPRWRRAIADQIIEFSLAGIEGIERERGEVQRE